MCKITVEYHIHVDLAQLIGIMELTYELVKHLIQNRKRRQINVLVITYSGSDSSRERKFLSLELSFLELSLPGAKVPGSDSSRERKFQELSLPEANVPGSESS